MQGIGQSRKKEVWQANATTIGKKSWTKKKQFPLLHTEEERSRKKGGWQTDKRLALNRSQVEADIKRETGGRVRKGGGKERAEYVIKAVITSFWNHFSQRALLEHLRWVWQLQNAISCFTEFVCSLSVFVNGHVDFLFHSFRCIVSGIFTQKMKHYLI